MRINQMAMALLSCVVCMVGSAKTIEHQLFRAQFPDDGIVNESTKAGVQKLFMSSPERDLQILVFPFSVDYSAINVCLEEGNCVLNMDYGPSTMEVGAREVCEVKIRSHHPWEDVSYEPLQGRAIALSNREYTVLCAEMSRIGADAMWWRDNIEWILPQLSEKPLAQRVSEYGQRMSELFSSFEDSDGFRLSIELFDNQVFFEISVQGAFGDKIPAHNEAGQVVNQLTSGMWVFKECRDLHYDYILRVTNGSDDVVSFEFPYAEHSTWY